MNQRRYNVFVIEDNPGDIALLKEVFGEAGLDCDIRHFSYGELAMDALWEQAEKGDLPNILFLDLNLRGDDGFSMLRKIKGDERLRTIPVIVMSSSSAPGDVRRAYASYANAYISKPLDLDDFILKIRTVKQFWFDTVQLPELGD